MRYHVYLILHFLLMCLWVITAIVLDYRFSSLFKTLSSKGKIDFLQKSQNISDKIELPSSFLLPLMGFLMLIDHTFWLKFGIIYWKILLGLLAIGLYHLSRGLRKKLILALKTGKSIESLINRYRLFRLSTLLVLVVVIVLIVSYKGKIETIYLIQSWFH